MLINVPPEILLDILCFCDFPCIVSFSQTCVYARNLIICHNDGLAYKKILEYLKTAFKKCNLCNQLQGKSPIRHIFHSIPYNYITFTISPTNHKISDMGKYVSKLYGIEIGVAAAERGYIDIIDWCLDLKIFSLHQNIFNAAAFGGHLKTLKYLKAKSLILGFISNDKNDQKMKGILWNEICHWAGFGGNLDMVKYCSKQYIKEQKIIILKNRRNKSSLYYTLGGAFRGWHKNLIKEMETNEDWNQVWNENWLQILPFSITGGHLEAVKYCHDIAEKISGKRSINFQYSKFLDIGLCYALRSWHKHIVKYFENLYANAKKENRLSCEFDWFSGMMEAVQGGKIESVQYAQNGWYKNNGTKFPFFIYDIVQISTSLEVIDYFKEEIEGGIPFEVWAKILHSATLNGRMEILEACELDSKVLWTEILLLSAVPSGILELVQYCEKRGAVLICFDWIKAHRSACFHNHFEIAEYCNEKIMEFLNL